MKDDEKIILLMKYTFNTDFALKNEYATQLAAFKSSPGTNPDDLLKLYRAKIRYEAFTEFTADVDRILHGR